MHTGKSWGDELGSFIKEHPLWTTGGGLAVAAAGGAGLYAVIRNRKKKKSLSRGKSGRPLRRNRASLKSPKRRMRRTPHTAGKGKDTSTRRIRYTKKGQPYIIKSDGKARFIKKSSARLSHKRKGGRY